MTAASRETLIARPAARWAGVLTGSAGRLWRREGRDTRRRHRGRRRDRHGADRRHRDHRIRGHRRAPLGRQRGRRPGHRREAAGASTHACTALKRSLRRSPSRLPRLPPRPPRRRIRPPPPRRLPPAQENAPLRDAYHQAPKDTVDQATYDGWKQFNLNCARCHGEDVLGTTIAPHLIVSLKPDGPINTQELFVQIVCAGRPAKGMPSWCALGMDPARSTRSIRT